VKSRLQQVKSLFLVRAKLLDLFFQRSNPKSEKVSFLDKLVQLR
jgi:hypothetical protein